jgi:K+-transporting ATPase KdpF subunit
LAYPLPTPTAASGFAEESMTDTLWVGIVTFMVFGYLTYALLMPEKF